MTFENVADNLRESFRAVAAARAAGELRELPGVSVAAAGVTFQMFNAAFLSAPVETEARIAAAHSAAHDALQSARLRVGLLGLRGLVGAAGSAQIAGGLERNGFRHSVDLPGMVAESVAPPMKPLPRVDVRRVADRATRDAFCAIGSVCFHVPLTWFREVFDNDMVWDRFAGYVGYRDEAPVSTAAIVMGGGAIGVYNVATMPERQHRGYGEAVMRHAVRAAQEEHGFERTILQSTPAGLRLYERMGYRAITRVSVYAS